MTELVHVGAIAEIRLGQRCDREPCGAQARVRVKLLGGGELDFCKHHFERDEPALLVASAGVVRDQRADLEVPLGLGIPEGQEAALPSRRRGEEKEKK